MSRYPWVEAGTSGVDSTTSFLALVALSWFSLHGRLVQTSAGISELLRKLKAFSREIEVLV
jgi:hypothetical protein